ncbi:MAG: GldG family protein, partial [Chthoniobacteraceae bacterium]
AIGANVFAQVLLIFVIILVVNIISFRQFSRWDFSRNKKYELSSMTTNMLKSMKEPVKAIVFFPSAQALLGDVNSLLKEYEYASKKKFSVEYVDPYKNLSRARELAEKYKFGNSDNIVILDYQGKSKFVNAQDMADLDMSRAMYGEPPTVRAFKGEQAITSALLELTEEKQNKLYFVTGHGEPDPAGKEITAFMGYAARLNLKIDPVNLNSVDAVPADASGLIIFGPKVDFSEREIKLVSDFWTEKNGRLFVLLGPSEKTPRLDQFLSDQGIVPRNDLVLRTGKVLARTESGGVALQTGIMTDPSAKLTEAGKEVTKELAGLTMQLLGPTQSLNLDPAKAQILKLKTAPIMESGEGFWGETEFKSGESKPVYFDPQKDKIGPVTIGAALEKGAMEDPRVKVETARMVFFGNAGFLTDDGLRLSEVGIDLAMNALNWITNRDEMIAGIAPKEKKPVSLHLDEKQLGILLLTVLGIIPAIVGLIGFATWWQRRA